MRGSGAFLKLLVFALLHASRATDVDVLDINSWSAIEERSFLRCPENVFSTARLPSPCDTTTTVSSTTTSSSSTTTISSTSTTSSSTSSTSQTSTSSTGTSLTFTTTSTVTTSTTATASLTVTSLTSTTSLSSSSTSHTTTRSSTTYTRSSTTTGSSTTTSETSVTSSSSTVSSSTTGTITSSTLTVSSRTVTVTSTTSSTSTSVYLGTTWTTSSSTGTTTSVTNTTVTQTTSTSSSQTRTVTSTSRTSTTRTTITETATSTTSSTTQTTRTITTTLTSITSTSLTSTFSTTTTTSFSTTITSSTILPQPCGNLCPLLALQGCDTLQPGEQCVPELLVDPCVEYSTQLVLQCPDKNTDLWRLPDATHLLPSARCRVCGFGSVDRDQDDRQGYYEADIYFGQNSIELDINEEPIAEYRVYVVDALQRRLGHHVATVQKNAESVGCCRVDAYRAHISTVLPAGFRRFMVVPVSKFGMEMPAGTMSEEIRDNLRGGRYHLGVFPVTDFSFLVNVADEMQLGNGSLMLRGRRGQEVQMPCKRMKQLKRGIVVPVHATLHPDEEYQVMLDPDCLVNVHNESAQLMAPAHGLFFHTEDGNATEDAGPGLLDEFATIPLSGALQAAEEFFFFFDKVALRGPGPLVVVQLPDLQGPARIFDDDPTLRVVSDVPGLVAVRPRRLDAGASYELVFGPGAVQDSLGNMAHSSKEFEERGEWEHRVACFLGDCSEIPPFGLDDYIMRVPVRGAYQDSLQPELSWVAYPKPGMSMSKHENLVMEFATPVSPDQDHVIELCSNWTSTDVCPMKHTVRVKDLIFVGEKVIINPPKDLEPGYFYNVSIEEGVVANFLGLRAGGAGQFAYGFHVSEALDRDPPELVAVEVDCSNASARESGCGVWHRLASQVVGEPERWGYQGMDDERVVPISGAQFRFIFREPVQLGSRAVVLWGSVGEEPTVLQEVEASVGVETEDCLIVAVPELAPARQYTLELRNVLDLATWPEPNLFAKAAMRFVTRLLAGPVVSLAANRGQQEAAATTLIKLTFEGPAVVGDPRSDLEVEIEQINPPSEQPDRQRLRVSDPSEVVFRHREVLLLPRPLLAGTSYRLTLPVGAVLHFNRSFTVDFTTRAEDLTPPSIVWTWPTGTLSKLTIDRMLVQIYFSEEVQPIPGKFILLVDDLGVERHRLAVTDHCHDVTMSSWVEEGGCARLDMEGRRLSLLPLGSDHAGLIPWAEPGRTYTVRIEEEAFAEAATLGGQRRTFLIPSDFEFSIHPDTEGPVLVSSEPANNSGDVEPYLNSLLLIFDEGVQPVDSDFAVLGRDVPRPQEAPQLEMAPGISDVNPEVGYITLFFNFAVEAGDGFFHIYIQKDPVMNLGENETQDETAELIKEVPVEEVFFVNGYVIFNPFPLPLNMGDTFFVGSNQSAILGNGMTLAEDLNTLRQAGLMFRVQPTTLRLVFSSLRDWLCTSTKLGEDVELFLNEQIMGLNVSGHTITLKDPADEPLWSLTVDDAVTDTTRIQVSLDPTMPFKATIHVGHLPPELAGSMLRPLSGGRHMLEVDEGLFLDRPEVVEENITVIVPPAATCGDFNFSCGMGRQLIENATYYRCEVEVACSELDNLTCCEEVPTTMSTTTTEVWCNDTACNETGQVARRLANVDAVPVEPPEPTARIETIYYFQVFGSDEVSLALEVCETRYQDLHNRSARIYVPLQVGTELSGRLRPQVFEVYLPATAVQDMLGNLPQSSAMISFTHDLQIPQLELSSCYPKNARNATEQESIQLGFSEPVKAGHGFFELWDVEDTSGPKIRVDVQSLALTDVGFYGRKLIDQNLVRAFPDALCDRGACRELESGITYFLTTSNVGVLYDMMDNPLPMLDTNTSGPWRFEVNENVTRAPEILRVNYAINMSDTAEVFGYVYFTQRVFQNGSFPGTVRRADSREIMIHDCGTDFDCAQAEEITDVSVTTDSWSDLGGVPGVLLFRTEVRPNVRLQVTVPPWSFMGADTRPGSLAGPLQPYTFLIDTGPDPRVPPIRPFILPDGRFPSNQQRYVPANTNITLYFSDEVRAGAGNISFCISLEEDANTSCVLGNFADGHVATLDVSHAEVQRRIVTWALPQDFAFGQALRVVMPEGLFVSANTEMTMEEYTGYSFSIQEGDIVPPRIIAVEPTARPDGLVKLIFSEAVLFEGAFGRQGSLALEEESSQAMVRFDATVEGAVVKLHGPFKTGESYRLRQTAELMDLVGNRAITVPVEPDGFSISEDVRGPEARLPMLREVHMHDTFFIEFDEAVVPSSTLRLVSKPPVSCGPACGRSQVLLEASAAQLPTATFESLGRRISLVQVEPPEPLLPGVEYELTVPASFVEDAVGNPLAHTSMQSYLVRLTRDLTPPKLMAVTLDGQGAPMSDFHQDEGGEGLHLYFSEALRPLASGTALQLAPSDGASRCSDGASRCLTNCTMPCGYMPAEHGLSIKSADVEIRGAVAMVRKAHLPFLEFGRGYRLELNAKLFFDLAGNPAEPGDGELVFRVALAKDQYSDRELQLLATWPSDGATEVPMTTSLQLQFDVPVQAGPGAIVLIEEAPAMPRIPRMLDNSTDGGSGNQSADPMARVLREELEGYNDSDLSNETNATEMPLPFDPDSPGAIHVPSSSCFIWHATVTCTLPALMRGRAYSVHYTHGAFREEGGLVKAGPRNPAPAFRVIDRHIMFPHILSLTPALMEPSDARRLDTFALAPKPMWYAPRGAILALEFSVPVQLGSGLLNLVDCSPGNSSRCYDGVQEMVPDEEVMSIEVSSSKDILLDGSRALLVSSGLREGHLHALQLSTLGVFRDEEGSPLLPHAGWEFWVQPDDSRTPEIFMQAPEHGGEAATNSNITLFFSEALQADMAGVINISDGLQDEIIMISTPSSSKGEGYVLVHGAVVIINPSLDFGYGRMVTVNFEPGVFRDLAGNLFPGLSGEYYFYTAPSQFALAAPYVRYPSFRSPRFTPREGAMLHFVNDTLILYGGISNGVCLADTWVSRTGAEWTQVTGVISDHNRLVPLVSHSPTSVDGNGCIWLLGGRCNSDAGTLWKTCDIGRSWSHVPRPTPIPFGQEVPPKFPNAFRDHAMTVLGGWQLIVVDASPGTSEAVWRFNSPAADHVQRVSGGSADAVSRKGPLPFGLRRGPKLMATSQGGLFLVGGNLCPANGGNCSFNDVWYSPDVGVTWHCKTKNYGAKTLPATWQGIGEGFAAALTQDDTIFLMAGEVPGDQESALAEALESFTGLEDIYLSQPYMVLPGSVSLGASPARPDANFTILFSEELKLADEAWALFHELPGNYSDLNDTNSSAGESVEAEMMVQGKDLVLRPRPMGLLPGRRYLIEMEGVQDKAGNNFGRIRSYDLQVQILEDWEAPEFLSMYPPHGAGGVEPWTLVTLTFNEDVFKGHGALQLEPMKAYGVHLELPISHGTVVLNQVVFKLPPERRLTADMEYRVLVPEGLVQDFIGNKVAATVAGSFRTMSGRTTTSNYFSDGPGMPNPPEPDPDAEPQEGFPRLLGTWPFHGATDVPARVGVAVLFYFEEPIEWTMDGLVHFHNETHIMTSIPTSEYDDGRNQSSRLQLLPNRRAVKVMLPPLGGTLLRPGRRFRVTLAAGALQDLVLGNISAAMRVDFTCLANDYGTVGPFMMAADVRQTEVPGSQHIFHFWYSEDLVKSSDQKPPVELLRPSGDVVQVPGESQNVTIDGNVLRVVFPEHVMGSGGTFTLIMPRFIFLDAQIRTGSVLEGGGSPSDVEQQLTFSVQPEQPERPRFNTSFGYPPAEEEDLATYEFPSNGRLKLSFSEEMKPGPGNVTFMPRSFGSPAVSVPGRDAIVAGSYALVEAMLLPGEVYTMRLDADAFLDLDGYSMEQPDDSYLISTLPQLLFRRLGSQQWEDLSSTASAARVWPSVAVDVNRIFLVGGRSPGAASLPLNDVWVLNTFKEVNCASAFEGETPCSLERCEADGFGAFTLGEQSFRRLVWRRRSVLGGDCIASDGRERSELGVVVGSKTLRCRCPTCTSHPGPPDGPPLPSDMLNDYYVQDYTLVASDDTRPLMCAPGLTPTGNFSCKMFDRYFAVFETPYPTCESSSCKVPPDVSTLPNFAAWDPNRSTDNRYCPDISPSDPLPHGGVCGALCAPGWKVQDLYRCDQGQFQAPSCNRMTCPMPQLSGRLECAEGPFFGATCALLCDPGYVPSDLQASCITQSMAPEAEPSFMPPAACTPGLCGDYQWLEGASVAYPNERRDVTSRAFLTCSSGYKPAGAALSLEGTVELRCGPVIDRENEPEVEWKVAFTGARAGLICAPEGMAVYDTVVLLGSITLRMALPDALNKDSLCTQYKDRFVGDVGLALVMALSSAGQVPLTASSVLNVEVSVCSGLGVRLRRLSSLNTTVSFAVKVENDLQALMLQAAVTEAAASAIFVRVFTVSLASSTGIQTSDIETSRMTRDILYLIDKPDGTQVPVVRDNSSNNTDNSTDNSTGPDDEEGFIGSPAFIAIVAGCSGCCCCCAGYCYLRWRYVNDVYADFEESEEEGFDDDEVIDVVSHK